MIIEMSEQEMDEARELFMNKGWGERNILELEVMAMSNGASWSWSRKLNRWSRVL